MTKAIVSQIDLGFAKFEGLMLPDGSYAIAVPQIADLIGLDRNQASRGIKRLLDNEFNPTKSTTEYTKAAVNIVDLITFRKIIRALDRQGNPIATALVDAFFEESVERRYDTAFGKKVTESERNQILAQRMKRLIARRGWTDILQERHIECYGTKPTPKQFRDWTVRVNQVLFSKTHFKCDRDNMQAEEQSIIETFEKMAVRRAGQNPKEEPTILLELALDTF